MDYKEYKGVWIGINGDQDKLVSRIKDADFLIADWDRTLVDLLAVWLPINDLKFWKPETKITDPDYYRWVGEVVKNLASIRSVSDVEKAVEDSWRDYHSIFLEGNEAELERIARFAESTGTKTIYPGVPELIARLPETEIHIATRNIPPFVEPLLEHIIVPESGRLFTHYEVFEKEQFYEEFLAEREKTNGPETYIILGDDEALTVPWKIFHNAIEEKRFVSVYVSKRREIPEHLEAVDLHIGRNYWGIVALLDGTLE